MNQLKKDEIVLNLLKHSYGCVDVIVKIMRKAQKHKTPITTDTTDEISKNPIIKILRKVQKHKTPTTTDEVSKIANNVYDIKNNLMKITELLDLKKETEVSHYFKSLLSCEKVIEEKIKKIKRFKGIGKLSDELKRIISDIEKAEKIEETEIKDKKETLNIIDNIAYQCSYIIDVLMEEKELNKEIQNEEKTYKVGLVHMVNYHERRIYEAIFTISELLRRLLKIFNHDVFKDHELRAILKDSLKCIMIFDNQIGESFKRKDLLNPPYVMSRVELDVFKELLKEVKDEEKIVHSKFGWFMKNL